MIQLTKHEANIYELMKTNKTLKEATASANVGKEAIRLRLPILIKLGLLKTVGGSKHRGYVYEHIPAEYEIVTDRQRLGDDVKLDDSLLRALETELTAEQIKFLKDNPTMTRTQFAKHFGMTKTELNFALGKV